jgi:hypothetical protein
MKSANLGSYRVASLLLPLLKVRSILISMSELLPELKVLLQSRLLILLSSCKGQATQVSNLLGLGPDPFCAGLSLGVEAGTGSRVMGETALD